jgi:predicted porin
MKKSLLALAALGAFAGAAQAQSSVTVYGIMDVGVMGATNSPNLNSTTWGVSGTPYVSSSLKTNQTSGQAFGMMYGGESMSRLGFKGQEDLGGGTKAIFDLETGIGPNGSVANSGLPGVTSGTANITGGDTALQGQLFGRAAYVGLSNDKYGQLTAGRQQNLMLDNIGGYDPVNAQMFSPINFSGSYGGGGYTDDSRVNGLKYIWTGMGGFNANAIYAPGGVTGQSTVGTTSGFQVGYEASKFGVQAIASHTTDGQSLAGITAGTAITAAGGAINGMTAAPSNAVAVTVGTTTAYMLTGKYNATDALTLKAGYERENIGTPSDYASVAGTPVTASGYTIATINPYTANKSLNIFWLGANYQFTPVIKGSVGYYNATTLGYADNATTAGGTKSQYWSAMVNYLLSKRTDLYGAVMANNNSAGNGYATTTGGNLITTSVTYGIGMRHTF